MENEFYNNTFASSDSAYAPSSSYLVHYGIPKKSGRYPWGSGKRPFQGDGDSGKWFEPTVKSGKDKPNISPAEKVIKETRNAVDSAQDIVDVAGRNRSKGSSEKARSMSDEELRKAVNRIQMERAYDSLTSQNTKSGFEITKEILSVTGSTLSIALSSFAIISTIKGMK